jgi:hypothetical protein
MAYDDSTGTIVLFGGQLDTSGSGGGLPLTADTWTWNGGDWTQQSPSASPPQAVSIPMDYGQSSRVLLGVVDDSSGKSETWQWDGNSWTQLQPTQAPTNPKQGAGMAYSTAVSASVLFGTQYVLGGANDGDTWTYSANTWKDYPAATGDPAPRSGPALAADQDGGVVMFGGGGSGYNFFNDTWTWAGSWMKKSPTLSPAARSGGELAFDSTCGIDVLYGGELTTGQQATYFSDTWIWDGSTWTKVG